MTSPTTQTSTNAKTSPFPDAFDSFDFAKQQSLDFFSTHSPSDILAPHPDLFESELDSSLAAFDLQLQLLTVDSNDAYSFLRSDTPTCGPPSTLTVSSESAYDSISSRSDSFYNYPYSSYSSSDYSFPLDLDMDFQRIRVDGVTDYASAVAVNSAQPTAGGVLSSTVDPTSFGTLPPTPPHSPPLNNGKSYEARSSFSDYGPSPRISITAPDYYSQLSFNADALAHSTVSPSRISAVLPQTPIPQHTSSDDGYKSDSRKKYKCNVCPRGNAHCATLVAIVNAHSYLQPLPVHTISRHTWRRMTPID
jgi:hypothetical protein